jgi:hypothetical protein
MRHESLLSGVSVSAPCNGQYAYLKRVRLTPDVYPRLILFTLLRIVSDKSSSLWRDMRN